MESFVSMSDFSPLKDVLESVPVLEVVPVGVPEWDKENKEKKNEDSDEVFLEKTPKGKNEKKENKQKRMCPQWRKNQENPHLMHQQK